MRRRRSTRTGEARARANATLACSGWPSFTYILWKYQRSMSVRARARGLLVDTVVYVAQLFVDRNIGSIRGRLRFRRERAKFTKHDAQQLPIVPMSTLETLQRRARRR